MYTHMHTRLQPHYPFLSDKHDCTHAQDSTNTISKHSWWSKVQTKIRKLVKKFLVKVCLRCSWNYAEQQLSPDLHIFLPQCLYHRSSQSNTRFNFYTRLHFCQHNIQNYMGYISWKAVIPSCCRIQIMAVLAVAELNSDTVWTFLQEARTWFGVAEATCHELCRLQWKLSQSHLSTGLLSTKVILKGHDIWLQKQNKK